VLKDHSKIGEIKNGPDVTAQEIVDVIAAHGVEAAAETLEEELPAIAVHEAEPASATLEEEIR
jgi:simple sugar transport system ATP-binding protein